MCKIIIYSHFNNTGTLNTMFCHFQDVMWSFSGSYFDFVRLLKKIHLKFDPKSNCYKYARGNTTSIKSYKYQSKFKLDLV